MNSSYIRNGLTDIYEPIVLMPALLDLFYKHKNGRNMMYLYLFYYKTAKRQSTNQAYCVNSFACKGTGFGRDLLIKTKKDLINSGLIQNIQVIDFKTKKVSGWYVKINFIMTKECTKKYINEINKNRIIKQKIESKNHPPDFQGGGTLKITLPKKRTSRKTHSNASNIYNIKRQTKETTPLKKPTSGKTDTNALSIYKKKQKKESKPKKEIKKNKTSLKKPSCLLVSDNSSFLKTIDEMTEKGFNWSSETLLKRLLEACPALKNRENAMNAVILYWKKVQRKKCKADSWNSNGIWVSKNLVPNAGRYYLKCQSEERAEKERIIEINNRPAIQSVSNEFFAERVRETKAMLNVECLS